MQCSRCKSLMLEEIFEDLQETGRLYFWGFRCPICGEIVDPLILRNRMDRPAPFLYRNRKLLVASRA